MSEKEILRDLLKHELILFDKTILNFNYSFNKIKNIELSLALTADQFELFDSFSSRFLRLYEVLFNQVIRTILILVNERQKTNLDNMNKAESLDLITSAADLDEIRKLRNQVAHAYLDEEWIVIYQNLLIYSKLLIESSGMTKAYALHLIR